MIPDLSSVPVPAPFVGQVNGRTQPLIDYEMGGPELSTPSLDSSYLWIAEYVGGAVTVRRDGVAPVPLFTASGITEIALAFDHSMNPHIAYVQSGEAKLRWWDTLANAYATMNLPGAIQPRICSDQKNPLLTNDRDVILAYTRTNNLYYRQQRDRFQIERLLVSAVNATLISVGMSQSNRFQFRMLPTS